MKDGQAIDNTDILSSFLSVTFADLKKYKFYYWFAFPAIMPQPDPWVTSQPISDCPVNILTHLLLFAR